jgi:CheY-like chemotaxis protein
MTPAYHVIIADDDDGIRAFIARVVVHTYPSVTISAVSDGLAALLIYEQGGAELVITNNAMPVLSGLSLIERLRLHTATLPIVMVSADATIEQRALALGASRFLVKPFAVAQLAQALTNILPP